MIKKIFIVDVNPFASNTTDTPLDSFIYERKLLAVTEQHYLTKGVLAECGVQYPREQYHAFDTRTEALIHLERVVLDMVQELEEQQSKLNQFLRNIEMEVMKDD